jgi:hypothetical protein
MNLKRLKKLFQTGRAGFIRQKGQAMIEYTVVSVFGILVLTTGPGRGVIEDLENAVRDNYDGYSYAVSLSDYPDKENYDLLIKMYNDQGMPSERREYLTDNPNDMIRELAGYALTSIPGVTQGLDMADSIGLDPMDFCPICSGNPFDLL